MKWIANIPYKDINMNDVSRPVRLLIDTFNNHILEDVIKEINKDATRIELICVQHENYISTPLDAFDDRIDASATAVSTIRYATTL